MGNVQLLLSEKIIAIKCSIISKNNLLSHGMLYNFALNYQEITTSSQYFLSFYICACAFHLWSSPYDYDTIINYSIDFDDEIYNFLSLNSFQDILSQRTVALHIEVRPRYLIPDTNCFVDDLISINAIANAHPLYQLMIPITGKFNKNFNSPLQIQQCCTIDYGRVERRRRGCLWPHGTSSGRDALSLSFIFNCSRYWSKQQNVQNSKQKSMRNEQSLTKILP